MYLSNKTIFVDFCDTIAFLQPTDVHILQDWLCTVSYPSDTITALSALEHARNNTEHYSSVTLTHPDHKKDYFIRYNSYILDFLNLPQSYAESLFSYFSKVDRHWIIPDTYKQVLSKLKSSCRSIFVVSNFDRTLQDVIRSNQSLHLFDKVYASANLGLEKPSLEFYKRILTNHDLDPCEVIMIGDSLELDILPACQLGMRAIHLTCQPSNPTQPQYDVTDTLDSSVNILFND